MRNLARTTDPRFIVSVPRKFGFPGFGFSRTPGPMIIIRCSPAKWGPNVIRVLDPLKTKLRGRERQNLGPPNRRPAKGPNQSKSLKDEGPFRMLLAGFFGMPEEIFRKICLGVEKSRWLKNRGGPWWLCPCRSSEKFGELWQSLICQRQRGTQKQRGTHCLH